MRAWERLVRWLKVRKGVAWPTDEHHIVDFLWDQMAERPSPSFPKTLMVALTWIEARAGLEDGSKLCRSEGLKKSMEKAIMDAEDGSSEKTRAPRLPVVVVAGLERAVYDERLPVCLRIVAWARLLKVFGALRSGDLQRIDPAEVELQEGGLTARLLRTKTSGAGKKVKDLKLFVPTSAWICTEGWLEEGYGLWRRAAPWPRDHFLPRPTADLEGFFRKVAEPANIAALNTKVLEMLKVPVLDDKDAGLEKMQYDEEKMLCDDLVPVWSGHSERATLASGLAAFGVPRSERDPLGRWCAEGSDTYVRSYRALVKKLVLLYVTKAMSQDGYIDMDEEDAIFDTRRLFEKRGVDVAKAEAGLKDLTSVAKDFFKVLADKYNGIAMGNAVELPVVGHKEGIEEKKT